MSFRFIRVTGAHTGGSLRGSFFTALQLGILLASLCCLNAIASDARADTTSSDNTASDNTGSYDSGSDGIDTEVATTGASGLVVEREGLSDQEIADLAARAMSAFDVPGMAIGIVRGNETVFAKGFGVREIGLPDTVNTQTMFKIASNSKAFTTTALAILADDGKIAWDGKLTSYIPEFKMYDPWVTTQFTVVDMLTHRSGLGKGAGDLMFWPEPNLYTQTDIVHALQFFEPVSSFRSEYAYDNTMYVVAGEVVARTSGQSWNEFVQTRIMQPLGMQRCFSDRIPDAEMNNLAVPHGIVEGELSVIERGRIPQQPPVSAAAGGIICSLDGMLTWVKTQLGRGTSPEGFGLFSEAQNKALWSPQTIMGVSQSSYEYNDTHFRAYGLGWRLADVHGYKEVSHTGTLAGMLSYVLMIPELDLGVIVMINGSSSATRSAVMNTIADAYMPVEPRDWVKIKQDEIAEWKLAHQEQAPTANDGQAESEATALASTQLLDDLSGYAGLYQDPWFGDVSIELTDAGLYFRTAKSPRLNGPLSPTGTHQFKARWIDRSLDGDAYVQFVLNENGQVTGMTMARLHEWSDWSFDYQDLNFTRLE